MVEEPFCGAVGLGKLVHFVVEYLLGSPGEESFHGSMFHNHIYRYIDISLGLLMSFSEKCKDYILPSGVD